MAANYKQMSTRVPAKLKPSQARSLKTFHRKAGDGKSLKQFLRGQKEDLVCIQVEDWLFNKRANTSNVQQCVGRTRTRVKKGGNKSAAEKNLSGR